MVHGEQGVAASFAQTITDQLGLQCIVPSRGESYVISGGSIYEHVPNANARNRFRRLAVVEMLETLKEEFDELSEILKNDLKQEKSDVEIDEVAAKLKMVEKSIIEALK